MKKGRDLLINLRRSFFTLHQRTTPLMDAATERHCYKPTLRWNPKVEDYFIKAYGSDHFACISEALTFPSCYSCIRVNTLKSTSDAIIEKLSAILQESGQHYVIDNKNQSDAKGEHIIDCEHNDHVKESHVPLNSYDSDKAALVLSERAQTGQITKCQLPGLDYVVFVKGSGPHTINYGCAHDKLPKEVIVSRKCAEAVLRGAQVYVPGILACSAHVEKGDTVAVSVAVEQPVQDGGWGIGMTRGTVLQGLQTDSYFFERNGLYIGQGTTMMSRAQMFRVPKGIAVDLHDRVFKLPSFHDVLEGEIFLQNLPSIIAAHALDPQQGERILDMCAAPGGKTTAIAILMKDKGEVVAVDRSHNKVLDIQKLAAEMGLNCITTYKLDALKAVRRRSESSDVCISPSVAQVELDIDCTTRTNCSNEKVTETTCAGEVDLQKSIWRPRNGPGRNNCMGGRVEKSDGFSPNSFDRVLLDAPCSALGLRPRLFAGEETIESLRNHAKYQRRMFDQAVQLVRPGGVIVYSTCTINPGENEALVRYVLDTYKFLTLALQHPRIGGPGLIGSCELPDGCIEEWLRPGEEELVQRFDPSSPLDTIGFFVAKFDVGSKDA
ncbi:rRNA (cytosine-C(5))-methyltransferase NOP2C isoform X2 [Actinidia eriantha]|uniref:rRNA (cytosine-C(5))-methyltransferase NOP2C isoform X2 n=1 Tax=Actinidia eriantha TaxID=165200 RepID=UPI002587013E|nr:rRNA (cytosine-C(5))-methyltransferase NOP2C isoform X2 [Actinidia eriantha]